MDVSLCPSVLIIVVFVIVIVVKVDIIVKLVTVVEVVVEAAMGVGVVMEGELRDTDGVKEKGVEEVSTMDKSQFFVGIIVPSYLVAVLWWWLKV